jgi:hypothetical protein
MNFPAANDGAVGVVRLAHQFDALVRAHLELERSATHSETAQNHLMAPGIHVQGQLVAPFELAQAAAVDLDAIASAAVDVGVGATQVKGRHRA